MTTGEGHINYEALAQDAFRGIVRTVLSRVAKSGLPGDHHFYIAFDTRSPGVVISKRLKERYPEEMTIVLQHRFWDLAVTESQFEVKLTFDSIPERLLVPFSAVKVFFDPSVPYGLQFEGAEAITDSMSDLGGEAEAVDLGPRTPRVRRNPTREAEGESQPAAKKPRSPRKPRTAKITGAAADSPQAAGQRVMTPTGKPDAPANDTKVIQLDQYRKK